jgi:hypothetical protein
MKTRPKTLSEAEIIKLADDLALVFWLPGSEVRKTQLRKEAQAYWETIKDQPRVLWLPYVLRLLLTCPPLFDRPTGFEWILNQVQWELYYRKANQSADRDFWAAVKQVRRAMRRGRPSDKARDYFRHERVKALMKERGITKTRAVGLLADLEGLSQTTRAIWKSLAQVKRGQTTRRKLLHPQRPAVLATLPAVCKSHNLWCTHRG